MRNIILLLMLCITASVGAQAPPPPPPPPPPQSAGQSDTVAPKSEPTLSFAEEMPSFPGGQAAFQKYLQENLHYPDSAKKYGREGTVYIYFEVSKDGSIGNVLCKKGVPGAPELAEEAIRVVADMPKWTPGRMNGREVKVSMTMPVKFTLM